MKTSLRTAIAAMFLLSMPAMAQPTPAKPACGKTVQECQKAFEAQAETISTLNSGYTLVRQQRDAFATQANDFAVQMNISQNALASANAAAAPKPVTTPPKP